jgi:micrococcal nuclease
VTASRPTSKVRLALGVAIILLALGGGARSVTGGSAGGTLGDLTAPVVEQATGPWTVHHVVDGDTVDVRRADGTEERVRVIGIDTPERGECGFEPATSAMAELVLGRRVELVAGARHDRDRFGRLLRYVDVDGVDAGLALIEDGLAVARYDSRDGYGRHDREAAYVAADATAASTCASPTPAAAGRP